MPAGRGSNLKDRELYEELRNEGASKEKAARISNAVADGGCEQGRPPRRQGRRLRGLERRQAPRTREGARNPGLLGQAQGGDHLDAPQPLSRSGRATTDPGAPRRLTRLPSRARRKRLPIPRRARCGGPARPIASAFATLVIPPAWEDVWISAEPYGHIQAVGVDEAGRRQYLYHPQWRARRDRGKFARALALAEALPRARGRVTTALRREGLDRERVLATSFRLLDRSGAPHRLGADTWSATAAAASRRCRDGMPSIDGIRHHAVVSGQERQAGVHRDRRRRARRGDGGAGDGTPALRPAVV